MNSKTLNQARFLQKTIKHLQTRMIKRFGPIVIEGSSGMSELTSTQLATLTSVRDHREMTLKEIAEATHVSPPSASTMVDKLVEAGALTREHSKVDRREVRVSISPRGLKAVEVFESHFLESLVDILDGIGPEQAETWCSVYERIEHHMLETEMTEHARSNLETPKAALGAN